MAASAPQTIKYEQGSTENVWEWNRDNKKCLIVKLRKLESLTLRISCAPFVFFKDEPEQWKDGVLRVLLTYRTLGASKCLLRQLAYKLEPRGISRIYRCANLYQVLLNKPINPIKRL